MRVLVTRPSDQAARTAKRLAALGHEAMVAPVAGDFSNRRAGFRTGRFDLVLATSAQAFADGRRRRPFKASPPPASAKRPRKRRATRVFGSKRVAPRAEALAEWLIAGKKPGAALYLAGRERKPVLEQRLARRRLAARRRRNL